MNARVILIASILIDAFFTVAGFRRMNLFNRNINSPSLLAVGKIPLSNKDTVAIKMREFSTLTSLIIAFPSITYAAGVAGIVKNEKAALKNGYLTEPTQEFVLEEKRVREFTASQMKIRQKWDEILTKFENSPSAAETESQLNALTAILVEIESIPRGVKKLELVKICRKKKFNGKKIQSEWTTPVEIAYQKLIQEFNKQVLPNNKVTEQIF